MSAPKPTVLWLRQDLRLADNPALNAAVARGSPLLPLFILDEETPGDWRPGGAGRWWLHHSLEALTAALARHHTPLILKRGPAARVLESVIEASGADAVYWNRCYEPFAIDRDRNIKSALKSAGLEVGSFKANLLFEPWEISTQAGEPYKVFTPFWRALLDQPEPDAPLQKPSGFKTPSDDLVKSVGSDRLEDWQLLPEKPDWAGGLRESWSPGEAGARARLAAFLDDSLIHYKGDRNRPDRPHTSRLSPHLRWGDISPRQIWHATRQKASDSGDKQVEAAAMAFLRELGWREFCHGLLYHWPNFPETSWKPEFRDFPWRDDDKGFRAWCRGRTGYPIVDAGMRELWTTGWMHNRVRMITASFLIKDLLVPWQRGERWFWDTLVDADLANNSAGWQWVAGCGADAAPYFRIFNPVSQGEKFDPDGVYVRRWVPELARVPDDFVHKPWEAPAETLTAAGVKLGRDYPKPLVDHARARRRALDSYQDIRKGAA